MIFFLIYWSLSLNGQHQWILLYISIHLDYYYYRGTFERWWHSQPAHVSPAETSPTICRYVDVFGIKLFLDHNIIWSITPPHIIIIIPITFFKTISFGVISTVFNLIYINSIDTETLSGPGAVERAINVTSGLQIPPQTTTVQFMISSNGVVLTDTKRWWVINLLPNSVWKWLNPYHWLPNFFKESQLVAQLCANIQCSNFWGYQGLGDPQLSIWSPTSLYMTLIWALHFQAHQLQNFWVEAVWPLTSFEGSSSIYPDQMRPG